MVAVVRRRADRLLDLDRSARRYDRRGKQGRNVAYARGQHSRRCDRPTRTGGAAGGRCPTAGAAADAQHLGQHCEGPDPGRQRRQLAADAAQAVTELTASGAVAHVSPGGRARTDAAVVRERQLLADLRARGVARDQRLGERDPRAHQQRLDGGDRDAERLGHVVVGHPAELAHQERRALVIGQPAHVGDQPLERLAPHGRGHGVVHWRA